MASGDAGVLSLAVPRFETQLDRHGTMGKPIINKFGTPIASGGRCNSLGLSAPELQMAEPAAKSSTPADGTPAVESPPLAPDGTPICYVVDDEPSIRHFLSLVLPGAGVDTVEFPDAPACARRLSPERPRSSL